MSHKAKYMEGLPSKTAIGSGACDRSECTSWAKLQKIYVLCMLCYMLSKGYLNATVHGSPASLLPLRAPKLR